MIDFVVEVFFSSWFLCIFLKMLNSLVFKTKTIKNHVMKVFITRKPLMFLFVRSGELKVLKMASW